MSVIKVWLRLDKQGDDEAIKLVFNDDNDVSDVLVRVPTAVNVGALRPSELALHLPSEVSGTPVSNRTPLLDLCESGSRELTFVIRPKLHPLMPVTMTAAVPSTVASTPQVQQSAPALAVQPRVSRHTSSDSSVSLAPARAKPAGVPLRRASSPITGPSSSSRSEGGLPSRADTSALPPKPRPQSPSPYRRTPSVEGSRSGLDAARKPSPVVRRPSPKRPPAAASVDVSHSAPSPSSLREGFSARRATASSLNRSSGLDASGATTQPPMRKQKDGPPQPNHQQLSRVNATHRAVDSATAAPSAPPSSSHASAASNVSGTSPATVCGHFKPQWGNVLCATCKHSKQAHLIRQREQNLMNMVDSVARGVAPKGRVSQNAAGEATTSTRRSHLDPATGLPSTPDARQRTAPEGGEGAHSAEFSLLEPPVMISTGTFGSPAPSFSS